LLIGTATAPSTIAMMAVAAGLRFRLIAIAPVTGQPNAADQWGISIPQPARFWSGRCDRMKRDGMKNIGYNRVFRCVGRPRLHGAKAAEAEGGIKF